MPEKNTTLHVTASNRAIIKRAKKLLHFYEEKTLSSFFAEKCQELVDKYDRMEK